MSVDAVLNSLLRRSERVDVAALALVCGESTVIQALALVDAQDGPFRVFPLMVLSLSLVTERSNFLSFSFLVRALATPWGRTFYTVSRAGQDILYRVTFCQDVAHLLARYRVADCAKSDLNAGIVPVQPTPPASSRKFRHSRPVVAVDNQGRRRLVRVTRRQHFRVNISWRSRSHRLSIGPSSVLPIKHPSHSRSVAEAEHNTCLVLMAPCWLWARRWTEKSTGYPR
jgi:hypothetical protein